MIDTKNDFLELSIINYNNGFFERLVRTPKLLVSSK